MYIPVDMLAIFLIIILSVLLCSGNSQSCILSHIVIGLTVIIFYKIAMYIKRQNANTNSNTNPNTIPNTIEKFYGSTTSDLNTFLSSSTTLIPDKTDTAQLSPVDIANYNQKLDTLINNITALQTSLNAPAPIPTTASLDIATTDLDTTQQYQMFQINYLQNQLKQSQDTLNSQTALANTKVYKPIKVLSSCIMSNADGTTNVEQPTDTVQWFSPTSSVSASPTTQQILQSTSQTSQPFINLSDKTGLLGNLVSSLGQFNNINVNLK